MTEFKKVNNHLNLLPGTIKREIYSLYKLDQYGQDIYYLERIRWNDLQKYVKTIIDKYKDVYSSLQKILDN